MRYDVEDAIGGCLFLLLGLVLGGIFVCAAVEGVQSYRAEPAEIACRAAGMDSERRSFHVAVTCVPRAGHAVDTRYVKVPQ